MLQPVTTTGFAAITAKSLVSGSATGDRQSKSASPGLRVVKRDISPAVQRIFVEEVMPGGVLPGSASPWQHPWIILNLILFSIYIIIHEGLKLFEYVITCYNLFTAGIILSTPMENKFSSAMISEG